ncbi:uncharacterized protein [Palaemon carinicauda]|uniref:uncharacterized protein n=1 Tax=Palaemon carinicauda TaxID=392227 RepID=UPI0035B5FA88
MEAEGRLVEHNCIEEKVLGYRYNVNSDTLSLAPCTVESAADTKRKVLSQISKVFDPLNFTLPALNEQKTYGLHVFCNSSTEAYGFVMYACSDDNQSSFLFAKSKLAPLRKGNEHSVPTLELMGVILALKCLPTLMETYRNIQFQFVNICADAKVVLNWIITKESKVKSKFIRNRILEVDYLKNEIVKEFKVPVKYNYVHTEQNPADLLTRGLSYNKFLENRKFWLEGPEWLNNNFERWPKYPFMSLSPQHKGKVNVNYVQIVKVNTGFLNINKFSSYERLVKFTSYFFRPLCKVKGGDPRERAKKYWIEIAQSECFSKEIEFLKKEVKSEQNVPSLVSNLNLFIDEDLEEGLLSAYILTIMFIILCCFQKCIN